jgi:hypothetical protein
VTQVTRGGKPSMGVAPRKGCAEGAGAVGGLAPAPFVYLQTCDVATTVVTHSIS